MATIARYTQAGGIVTIDGTRSFIPGGHGFDEFVAEAAANGDTIEPYAPPVPTVDDVWAEKDRRWAVGFDYDFGDERGVHHIGTTDQDMKQWTENVSVLAQAAINLGQPNTRIEIDTDTGSIDVTATEWQSIIIAAGQFRQPIFQAALALVAMDPIPADYADDSHWP